MAKKVKIVLSRNAFSSEVLHEAVEPVMDGVQKQMKGMAEVHPPIKVYRNEDTDRSNVVAACPAAVGGAHDVLTRMIGKMVI